MLIGVLHLCRKIKKQQRQESNHKNLKDDEEVLVVGRVIDDCIGGIGNDSIPSTDSTSCKVPAFGVPWCLRWKGLDDCGRRVKGRECRVGVKQYEPTPIPFSNMILQSDSFS